MTLYKPAGFPPWTADCSSDPETPPLESVSAKRKKICQQMRRCLELELVFSVLYFQSCAKARHDTKEFWKVGPGLFFSHLVAENTGKHQNKRAKMDFTGLTFRLVFRFGGCVSPLNRLWR